MDLQTWGILLFFFGLPYIIWISAQFKGESPGTALGIVSLVLVANVAVPIAFATFMHWSLGLGVFLLGLLFIRFMRNRDVRTQGPFSPVKSRVVCKSERKLLDASVRLPWRPPWARGVRGPGNGARSRPQ